MRAAADDHRKISHDLANELSIAFVQRIVYQGAGMSEAQRFGADLEGRPPTEPIFSRGPPN